MNFFENPKKAKIAFVITLIVLIISLIGNGVLGYFFYKKNVDCYELYMANRELRSQQEADVEDLQEQITVLTEEKATLEKQKSDLEKQAATDDTNFAKIKAYNEFFKYMNSVIETHGGYEGWTEAEYQIARGKAQATGNSSFVSTVDWAWHRTDIDPITRILRVLKEIASGIDSGL